ncbi:MAG: Ig-like domain-containing protein [Bernardetiaceae bacterium]|nr:Ig-like domain-containing protein [Bernardetiaceae bacterium]
MRNFISIFNIIALVAIVFILKACASIGNPMGGPKDEDPPVLLLSTPADQAVNFRGQTITFYFDEYIETRGLNDQLQIIPYKEGMSYKHKIRKEVLTLEFEQPFEENTTYTLLFGEAIKDISERNPAVNLRLAFSTGPLIDSLTVSGVVRNPANNKRVAKALVGLYDEADTLTVDKYRPLYYAFTDTAGRYEIPNIKDGKYRIYALAEIKKNLKYDNSEDMIAVRSEPLDLNQNYENINLDLVRFDIKPFRLLNARGRKQYFDMKFNKSIPIFYVDYADKAYDTIFYYQKQDEVWTFYNRNSPEPDSVSARIFAQDSVGNSIDTTLTIKFNEFKKREETSFSLKEFPSSGSKMPKQTKIDFMLEFSKPVIEIVYDSISFLIDEDTIAQTLTPELMVFDSQRMHLKFKQFPTFEKEFKLEIKEKSFISIENDSLEKKMNYIYSYVEDDQFGILSGRVLEAGQFFIVQVIDEQNHIEKEMRNETNFEFKRLEPGKKRLRVILDTNNNGKWDKGDWKTHTPPETIYYHDEEIELKANWEFQDIMIRIRK